MNKTFITKMAKILGDNFFLCDMIHQDELFEMQDKLAKLICEYANKDLPNAKYFVKECPQTFKVS